MCTAASEKVDATCKGTASQASVISALTSGLRLTSPSGFLNWPADHERLIIRAGLTSLVCFWGENAVYPSSSHMRRVSHLRKKVNV